MPDIRDATKISARFAPTTLPRSLCTREQSIVANQRDPLLIRQDRARTFIGSEY